MWVPGVVRRLREEYPGLVIDLALNETANQQQGLRADIDIRVEDPETDAPETPGRCRRVLAEEPYVCIVSRDHALAGRREIGLADLDGEAWIRDDRVESMCTQIINRAAAAAGVTPNYVARSDDHHTAMAFVDAGSSRCCATRPKGAPPSSGHRPARRRRPRARRVPGGLTRVRRRASRGGCGPGDPDG